MSEQKSKAASLLSLQDLSLQNLVLFSLAAAVILIVVIIFITQRQSSTKKSAVLLVGSSDAGKTAIFTSLIYKQTLPTHTSLQTSVSPLQISSASKGRFLRLIDIPGHPRLRDDYKEHISDAKAIVFVVDASTVARNAPHVAEHLHRILNALMVLPPNQTPVLAILAHKADLLTSPSSNASTASRGTRAQLAITRVRTILERELEKRRASHAEGVSVEGLGAEGQETEMEIGGLETRVSGDTFKFSAWEGGEVAFFGTELKVSENLKEKGSEDENFSEDGLEQFIAWLEDL